MDVHGVPLGPFTTNNTSSMDMQGVSISTASSMEAQGVSLSTSISMDVEGVYVPFHSQQNTNKKEN